MSSSSSRTHDPGGDGPVGVADDVAVAHHGLAGFEIGQRDLVRLGNALPRGEPAGQNGALGGAFGMDDDGDIVARVHANVHHSIVSTAERPRGRARPIYNFCMVSAGVIHGDARGGSRS